MQKTWLCNLAIWVRVIKKNWQTGGNFLWVKQVFDDV